MYLVDFEEYLQASEALYMANPERTRYVFKYRAAAKCVVLKVTDDVRCLKFKTNQQEDLKQVERLNQLFLRLATSSK